MKYYFTGKRMLGLLQLVLFVTIFAIDVALPLGVAAGVPYLFPVLLSYFSRNQNSALITAVIGSFLIVAGYFISGQGGIVWMVLANRAIALFAIWSTALLVINHFKDQRLSLQQLNTIDQNVNVATFSSKGIITNISNNLCRYFGVIKEDIIGKKSNFLFMGMDEQAIAEMWVTLKSGEHWDGELRYETSAGEVKWAYSSIHPVLNNQYKVTGYNNFISDITDKKLLEEISLTDPLTSLPNRRYFDETFAKEIKLAQREKWSMTLAIIDIDYFKDYNDHYGHPEGDEALINVANSLKTSLGRPSDHVCRIGGEEFAIFFPQSGIQESEKFLANICASIEALKIPHEKSEVSQFLTISIGAYVCKKGKAILSKEQFFKAADTALYTAKEKRNCTILNA